VRLNPGISGLENFRDPGIAIPISDNIISNAFTQTADKDMDCGRGSLVKLCGLRRNEFFDPHTSVDCTPRKNGNSIVSLRPVSPATHVVIS